MARLKIKNEWNKTAVEEFNLEFWEHTRCKKYNRRALEYSSRSRNRWWQLIFHWTINIILKCFKYIKSQKVDQSKNFQL